MHSKIYCGNYSLVGSILATDFGTDLDRIFPLNITHVRCRYEILHDLEIILNLVYFSIADRWYQCRVNNC